MNFTRLTALIVLACSLSVLAAGCGGSNKEDEENQLLIKEASTSARNLAELMKNHPSHVLDPVPWSGYWFPYKAAGIASAASRYDEAYLRGLRALGRDTSNYQYASPWEAGNHGPSVPKIEPWFGHCNGWTASAIMIPEPRQGKTINGVYFSVGDLKALLAESWLEFTGDFVGTRVNDKGDYSSAAYWDIAPAQFHMLLANIMGKQNRGIIIDRHTGHEVWNQPLVAYEFLPIKPEDYLGPHPGEPNIHRVNVTAIIYWANDNVPADHLANPFNIEETRRTLCDGCEYAARMLKYELWLDGPVEFDGSGNISRSGDILVTENFGRYVGGIWKSQLVSSVGAVNAHPDYMWMPYGRMGSSGYKNPRIDDVWVKENIGDMHRPDR